MSAQAETLSPGPSPNLGEGGPGTWHYLTYPQGSAFFRVCPLPRGGGGGPGAWHYLTYPQGSAFFRVSPCVKSGQHSGARERMSRVAPLRQDRYDSPTGARC
jgi:hypothetical protein